MPVLTRSQTKQSGQTLPSTSEYLPARNTQPKMAEEANNKHATEETKRLIEQALAQQRTEMYEHFNEILARLTSSFGSTLVSNSTRNAFDKASPFKVQMNLDIPNLEGKIDAEFVDNCVQQL